LQQGAARYQRAVVDANLALGRMRAAEEMCRRGAMSFAGAGTPSADCLMRVAYARDNRQEGAELLRASEKGLTKFGYFANLFLSTVWLKEGGMAEGLAGRMPSNPMAEGLLSLVRDRAREAADRLGKVEFVYDAPVKAMAGTPSPLLWYRQGLATALERDGRLDEAIAAIEPFTRPGAAHLSDAWPWPQAREKAAELYRRAGRPAEAARIEEELRRSLSAADADYPLRARLEVLRAARQ
jgi:hypothetical protein